MGTENTDKYRRQITAGINKELSERIDKAFRKHEKQKKGEFIEELLKIGYEEFTKAPEDKHPRKHMVIPRLNKTFAQLRQNRVDTVKLKFVEDTQKELLRQMDEVERTLQKIDKVLVRWNR